jgi:ABC-type branched-subunit amino acid transport system substrate-binding protein
VKRRVLASLAMVAALGLLLGACAKDKTPSAGGTPTAEKCKPYKKATALGLGGNISMAGAIHALNAQSKPTVKIGFIGDLTGDNSSLVVGSRDGAKLAFELANAKGDLPVNIEFVILDNKNALESTAAPLAQQLINDKEVVAVVGPAFSGETSVATPLFCRANIVNITPSATRVDLTAQGWQTFFRGVGDDDQQSKAAAKLLVSKGFKKIAVVNDKSPYGQGLGQGIVKELRGTAGVTVVLDEGVAPTTNYTSLVDSMLAKQPDAVYYAGYVAQAPLILKQMRNKGLKAQFASGDGSKEDKFIATAGKTVSEGVLFTCPCLDPAVSSDPAAVDFSNKFKAKYGHAAPIYAAEGWDLAQIYIAALKAGKTTRAAILEFVTDLKDFVGLTKTFNWTTDPAALHEPTQKGVNIYGIKNGKLYLVGPIEEVAK